MDNGQQQISIICKGQQKLAVATIAIEARRGLKEGEEKNTQSLAFATLGEFSFQS